jgi:hypothetical protein
LISSASDLQIGHVAIAFLCIGRTPVRRFLFRGFAALILHLAAVEAHSRIVVEWERESISNEIGPQQGKSGGRR